MDDADSLLAEITGTANVMDDMTGNDSIDDDDADAHEQIAEVVASTNGNSSDPRHPDPQNSALGSEPTLHSIPHIGSPPNLTGTPVPVTTHLESDTCESTSVNPNKDIGILTGGGGTKNED